MISTVFGNYKLTSKHRRTEIMSKYFSWGRGGSGGGANYTDLSVTHFKMRIVRNKRTWSYPH